ncbi:MAG: hypothetical protein EBZ40_11790, partial [Gammaproteobacteria bacterium]|nr:hypothetical protein [Gammaproteobacteria bacterium]
TVVTSTPLTGGIVVSNGDGVFGPPTLSLAPLYGVAPGLQRPYQKENGDVIFPAFAIDIFGRVTAIDAFNLTASAINAWLRTGNAGMTSGGALGALASGNFLGTTDAVDLRLVTNGFVRAIVSSAGDFSLGGQLSVAGALNVAGPLSVTSGIKLTNVGQGDSTDQFLTLAADGSVRKRSLTDLAGNFWYLGGNTNTTPGTGPNQNFLGTTDAQDLLFATNGVERLRIGKTGELRVSSLGGTPPNGTVPATFDRIVLSNPDGTLSQASIRGVVRGVVDEVVWLLAGNANTDPDRDFLGTTDAKDLVFRTNGLERLRITAGGELRANGALNIGSLRVNGLGGGVATTLRGDRFVIADESGLLTQVRPSVLLSSITDPIAFGGDVRVRGKFSVDGASSFFDALSANGGITTTALNATGAVTFAAVGGPSPNDTVPDGFDRVLLADAFGRVSQSSAGALLSSITGPVTFNSPVTFKAPTVFDARATFNQTVTLNAGLKASGGIDTTVLNATALNTSSLTTSGVATLNSLSVTNGANVGGGLAVTGSGSFGGLLTASGGIATTALTADSITTGTASVAGDLRVTGVSKFSTLGGATPGATVPSGFDRIVMANADGTLSQASLTAIITNLPNANAWALVGNSGTNPANQFIGTTDNVDFVIRTNNALRMTVFADGRVGIAALGNTAGASLGINDRVVVANGDGTLSQVRPSALLANITDPISFGGAVNVAGSLTTANAVISGGSINNTPIGNLAPSTGAFTDLTSATLTTTGNVVLGTNPGATVSIGAGNSSGAVTIGRVEGVLSLPALSGPANLSIPTATNAFDRLVLANADGTLAQASISAVLGNSITSKAWTLIGNAGSDPSVNFIGTTDTKDFVIRTDNVPRARFYTDGSVGIFNLGGMRNDAFGGNDRIVVADNLGRLSQVAPSGLFTGNDTVTFNGILKANGGIETTTLTASGAAAFTGVVSANGGLTTNSLAVNGASTLVGTTSINATGNAPTTIGNTNSPTTVGGALNVTGISNFTGALTASNATISQLNAPNLLSGNATISGGAINNTPIGNLAPSTGAFTALTGDSLNVAGSVRLGDDPNATVAIGAGNNSGPVTIGRTGGSVMLPNLAGATANTVIPSGFDRLVLADASGNVSQASFSAVVGNAVGSTAWLLGGNAGTDPQFNYIGTTDAKDFIIKTDREARIRVAADGGVRIAALSGNPSASLGANDRIVVANGAGLLNQIAPSALFANVSDPISFGGLLNASNGITTNSLSVNGTSALNGVNTLSGTNTLSGVTAINTSGTATTTIGNANSATSIGGALSVAGASTFASLLTANGGITADTLTTANAVITGGSINGTPIGNSVPSTGAFTTLSSTGNTNLGSGTGATVDIGTAVASGAVYIGRPNGALTVVSTPTFTALGGDANSPILTNTPAFDRIVLANRDGTLSQASIAAVVGNAGGSSFWTLMGNANTAPGTGQNQNYLGTSDLKDFILATNGAERLRLSAAGTLTLQPVGVNLGETNELRFAELAGGNYVGFKAPDVLAGNTIYTLPSAFPTANGYILTTDTSGVLSWANLATAFAGTDLAVNNFTATTITATSGLTLGGLPTGSGSDDVLLIDPATNKVKRVAASTFATGANWSLSGNANTDPANNFLGT